MRVVVYGRPSLMQRIRSLFVKKVWYRAYVPLIDDWNEEEQ